MLHTAAGRGRSAARGLFAGDLQRHWQSLLAYDVKQVELDWSRDDCRVDLGQVQSDRWRLGYFAFWAANCPSRSGGVNDRAFEFVAADAASGISTTKHAWSAKMTRQQPASEVDSPKASHEDLTRILGDLDDAEIVEILELHPTVSEVEQAALWAAGEGDALARKGHELVGVVASIVDIVTADEEDEEPPRTANP